MPDLRESRVTLPTQPLSVREARRHAVGAVARWGLPRDHQLTGTVRLVVSELATNAVLHTLGHSPTFTLSLVLDQDHELRIGVADSCSRRPRQDPAPAVDDSGRGLLIVGWLAVEAGGSLSVSPEPDGGKSVWVSLPWAATAVR